MLRASKCFTNLGPGLIVEESSIHRLLLINGKYLLEKQRMGGDWEQSINPLNLMITQKFLSDIGNHTGSGPQYLEKSGMRIKWAGSLPLFFPKSLGCELLSVTSYPRTANFIHPIRALMFLRCLSDQHP